MKASFQQLVEIIGITAVVLSLIFVGMQLRQEQEIARANQYQARAETEIASFRSRLESEPYLRAEAKILAGDEDSLTELERSALSQSIVMSVIQDDNEYHQYLLGYIPEEFWLSKLNRIRHSLRLGDVYRLRYASAASVASPEYMALVQSLIDEIEDE